MPGLIRIGSLEEGDSFLTSITDRTGIVLTRSTRTQGVVVRLAPLGSVPEEIKAIHEDIKVIKK